MLQRTEVMSRMANEHSRVLAETSKNPHTMLAISREGTILRTEPLDASATMEQMAEMTRANSGQAGILLSRRDLSEEQLQEIIAYTVRNSWGMRMVIADAPDKEKEFAELYYGGEIWRIVSQEQGPLVLEIQANPRMTPIKFELQDVIEILLQGKWKLGQDALTEQELK